MTDKIKVGEFYSIDYLKDKNILNSPSFLSLYNLNPTEINANSIPNALNNDTSVVMQVVIKPYSDAGNGIITTSYRDDYIIRGQSFANEITRVIAAAGTEFFVLDAAACNCSQVIKLPISLTPSSGTVIVNLYEDTDYTGVNPLFFANRNRLSNRVAGATLKDEATGIVKGSLLFSTLFGTESKPQNAGGGAGNSANALVLDPSKKYLFEVIYSEACTVGYNMEIVEV